MDSGLRTHVARWWATAMAIVSLPFVGLMTGHTTGISSDLRDYHLPLFRWAWRTIGDGETPLWASWSFGGQNIAGIGQGALWYPPNAIFGVLGAVPAFRWWTMFHLWLAASGAFLWAWRRWGSAPAAAVTAVLYGLNGAFVLHLIHANFTIVSAWLPWMCLGLDRLLERPDARGWMAFATPLAFIGLAGHPQVLFAALLAVAFIGVVTLARRGVGLRPWLHLAGATALGLAVAAVQILPQVLFSRTSVRPELDVTNSFQESADIGDLLSALWPQLGRAGLPGTSGNWFGDELAHETSNHLGAAALALAVIAVVSRWRDRRVLGLALLAVFGFLAALGDSTPFGRLAFRVIPLADRFRIWPRYLMLTNLSIACLAGLGVTVLVAAPARWRRGLLVAAAVVALLGPWAVAAATNGAAIEPSVGDVIAPAALAVLAIVALWWSAGLAGRRPVVAAAVILTSCAIPAVLFTLSAPWRYDAMSPEAAAAHFDEDARSTAAEDAPGGVDRWMSRNSDIRGIERVQGTDRTDGYEPLLQADFATITGAVYVGGIDKDHPWLAGWTADVLRITTLVTRPDDDAPGARWQRAGTVEGTRLVRWIGEPRLADAAVVGAVVVQPFDTVAATVQSDSVDLTGTVLIEDDAPGVDAFRTRSTAGSAGSVSGDMSSHGTGRFQVEATRAGVLVLSTAWLEGWSATVNGQDVPVARANGLVLAIPVDAGRSDVRLSFSPPGLVAGGAISALALATLLATGVTPMLRRRARRHGEGQEAAEGA